MILQINTQQKTVFRKNNWKEILRQQLYAKNKAAMSAYQQMEDENNVDLKNAEMTLLDLFKTKQFVIKDNTQLTACHSYYSTYIPLSIQSRFDDQVTCTFPYIRYLQQVGRVNDRSLILVQLSNFMKECRQECNVDVGWQKCLRKYICGLDSIQSAELYLELKKKGTKIFEQLHKKYGDDCLKQVFFQRICKSANFFRKLDKTVLKITTLSVQYNEQINQITMPKTMKNLFCSICMIYDCGQHILDDFIKDKHYQYVSPINLHDDYDHLANAMVICEAYQQLLLNGVIKIKNRECLNICTKTCYQLLNFQEWQKLQKLRGKLLSPLVKGVIKLGIQIYSYSPCDIWFMLAQDKITCSLVFLFLIEEYDIVGRLGRKLAESQEDMLRRQLQTDCEGLPEPPRKNRRKLQITTTDSKITISNCCHYFVGQQPIDINCQNCACRERGFCITQCLCQQNCAIRKRGCNCKREDCRTKKCPCFNNKEECDPQLCRGCYLVSKKNVCRNHQLLDGKKKRVRVGKSVIPGAGLGLFAGENIKKDDFVMIYTGELIDQSIDVLRESLSVDHSFYNFGSPQGTIDARFMGNLSRFINHGDQGMDNLVCDNVLSQGRYKIAFFAIRQIEAGQQLFFNYDGAGELYKNYKDKYPFINSKKKNSKN